MSKEADDAIEQRFDDIDRRLERIERQAIIDAEPNSDEVYKKVEDVIRKQLYRHERPSSLPDILKLLRETK